MATISKTTVRQVLDDIKVRLPHEYSEESLFLWINETMKKIYKDLELSGKKIYCQVNQTNLDTKN